MGMGKKGIVSSGSFLGLTGINPLGSSGSAPYAYLLDDYSGAVLAYSLRHLRSAYAGALIQIRRSSDSALKDFYPDANHVLSLTSEDGSGTSLGDWITTDDGYIRIKYDQSTVGSNTTQTTASKQIKIITAGVIETENGKPMAIYDGTDDSYPITSITAAAPWTAFNVVTRPTTSTLGIMGLSGTQAGSPYHAWVFSDNNVYAKSHAGFVSGALNSTTQQILTSNFPNASTGVIRNNGTEIVSASPATSTTDNFLTLGVRQNDYGDGNWQETVHYSSNQTANITGIEANINNFYGAF